MKRGAREVNFTPRSGQFVGDKKMFKRGGGGIGFIRNFEIEIILDLRQVIEHGRCMLDCTAIL